MFTLGPHRFSKFLRNSADITGMGSITPLVAILDRTGRSAWISRGDSGVSRDELLGTTIWDWTVGSDAEAARQRFMECLRNGTPQQFHVTVNALGTLVGQCVTLEPTGGVMRPVVVTSQAIPLGLQSLTPRQREVLKLVGQCFSQKQIARMLGISVNTVNVHCIAIERALGLHSMAELAVFSAVHLHD